MPTLGPLDLKIGRELRTKKLKKIRPTFRLANASFWIYNSFLNGKIREISGTDVSAQTAPAPPLKTFLSYNKRSHLSLMIVIANGKLKNRAYNQFLHLKSAILDPRNPRKICCALRAQLLQPRL